MKPRGFLKYTINEMILLFIHYKISCFQKHFFLLYRFRKRWLKTTGSPSSRIEKAEFKNEADIKNFTFSTFDIKR